MPGILQLTKTAFSKLAASLGVVGNSQDWGLAQVILPAVELRPAQELGIAETQSVTGPQSADALMFTSGALSAGYKTFRMITSVTGATTYRLSWARQNVAAGNYWLCTLIIGPNTHQEYLWSEMVNAGDKIILLNTAALVGAEVFRTTLWVKALEDQ